MAIDQRGLELEARLAVLEMMLTTFVRALYGFARYTPDQVAATHERFRKAAEKWTFPGTDPALSDLAAAAFQDELERLLAMVAERPGNPAAGSPPAPSSNIR